MHYSTLPMHYSMFKGFAKKYVLGVCLTGYRRKNEENNKNIAELNADMSYIDPICHGFVTTVVFFHFLYISDLLESLF